MKPSMLGQKPAGQGPASIKEEKKLTFDEWFAFRFPWGESPMPREFIHEIWKTAQENKQ